MSDKNRNMNDINDQKTAEQQAFSEEIRRRLAEPGSGKPTLDEFKVMVYKDREKRRKKRNALVACIVAAFIVGFLSLDALVPEVGADKNPKETIKTEDGVIIEDGGWGSSEEDDNVWVTEDWNDVMDARELFTGLLIPTYVPEEYTFMKLEVKSMDYGQKVCEYNFIENNSKDILEIEFFYKKTPENSLEINNVSKRIESTKGDVYIQEDESKATIQIDGGIIVSIWCDLSEDKILKIIDYIE